MDISLTIRRAVAGDLPFIVACENDPASLYVHGDDLSTHQKNISDPDLIYIVAENTDGERLGYAILARTDVSRTEWRRIIVAKPGAGTGKKFMRAVIDDVFSGDTESIWLDVYEENTHARRVYASIGFEETYREPSPKDPQKTLVYMALGRPKD